jgi:RNA polymerase sigma-70 factor (ECF subfamily)
MASSVCARRRHRGFCRPGGCALLCTEDGIAAAYASCGARLLAHARRIVVDAHAAEEVVQDAFTRAWQACSSFDPQQGPVINWLLTIVTNAAIDLVKARLRRPPVAPGIAESAAPATHGGIDLIALRSELRDALAGLTDAHRDAVVETIVFDRPTSEVATRHHVNAATLRTRVHYALRRMRTQLEAIEGAA